MAKSKPTKQAEYEAVGIHRVRASDKTAQGGKRTEILANEIDDLDGAAAKSSTSTPVVDGGRAPTLSIPLSLDTGWYKLQPRRVTRSEVGPEAPHIFRDEKSLSLLSYVHKADRLVEWLCEDRREMEADRPEKPV